MQVIPGGLITTDLSTELWSQIHTENQTEENACCLNWEAVVSEVPCFVGLPSSYPEEPEALLRHSSGHAMARSYGQLASAC